MGGRTEAREFLAPGVLGALLGGEGISTISKSSSFSSSASLTTAGGGAVFLSFLDLEALVVEVVDELAPEGGGADACAWRKKGHLGVRRRCS